MPFVFTVPLQYVHDRVVLRCCAFVFICIKSACAFRVLITIVGVCCFVRREREKKTLNAIEKCESKLKTSCDKGEEKKTHSTKTGIRLTRHSAKDMCTMKHPPAFRAEIFAIRKRFFIYKQNTIHLNYLLFI